MWSYDPPAGAARLLASAAFVAAVTAFLLAQELGLRLRRAEHRDWWAGTGRDLLNGSGLLAISGTLWLLGLSWPAALLVGGTLTLLLFGASVLVATRFSASPPRAWAVGAGLALSLAVLVKLGDVAALVGRAAGALFELPGGPAAP